MTGRRQVAPLVVTCAVVAVINGITMAISYQHEYELASRNGQAHWVSALLPFSVDGLLLVASVALLWAARHGISRPVQPLVTGAVGIGATIAANYFSDVRLPALGPVVAASSGVSSVLVSWVLFWLFATQRKIAAGEDVQRSVACSCPAPATSLAEALPLARSTLRDLGEPHGEEALADRFGVTRHRVRQLTVAPVEPASLNGHGGAS